MKPYFAIFIAAICANISQGRSETDRQLWHPDSLLTGYEYRYVNQGSDYSGPVRSTIIRREAEGAHVGMLYIHGFNDYFFQSDMADFFVDNGISFYAVDLRKYGRSLMSGQYRYQCRDLTEYFPDIDSTLNVMRQSAIDDVVIVAHSTGGLIATYYLMHNSAPQVKGLILNSPFLDWNLSKFQERILVPMIDGIGALAPGLKIPQGSSTAYSQSLLEGEHGRFSYDTTKKLRVSPPVEASWIRAVDRAQADVQRGNVVNIPILLMHSDSTVTADSWTEACNHGDVVLDVADISRYGRRLGPSVTEATVRGGMHDLVLSEPDIAQAVLNAMLAFVRRLGL